MNPDLPDQVIITEEIPDEKLKYLILGAYRMVPWMEQFPVKVREVVDNYDSHGTIESFTIVTESGLRFTIRCEFDGQTEPG